MSSARKVVALLLCLSSLAMAQSTPGATEQSCLICKAVANINLITPVESQAAELDALCNGLEGEDSILCGSLRDQSFTSSPSTTEQCAELGHCEQPQEGLVGAEKCTFGPSYWCQSALHAKACGATAHCEERVWN